MKRKKKKMSTLVRVLLCSWCVLGLVLAFFVIKWAAGLKEKNPDEPGNVDVFAEITQGAEQSGGPTAGVTKPATPTPVPKAEFVTEYAHTGEMTEDYGYRNGVAYGVRYPAREDAAEAESVRNAANGLLEEMIAKLAGESGTNRTLLIDYEDGETAGLYSVLFYIETEKSDGKETETVSWIYNKKKGETVDGATLFAAPAYRYAAQQVNLSEEEFPEYLLTADGAKFYYEAEGERRSVLIPYIAVHTYMAVTENGTVIAEGIRELDPDKPMIALTFDDGPHYQQTPRLLELLAQYDAKCTFFILGDRSHFTESNKKTVKMVADAGQEIASHTYSHKNLATLTQEELTDEIVKARENIYALTGEYPVFVRPPYGSYNDLVKEYSYAPLISWNLDSGDWNFRDTKKVVDHVLSEVGDGKIVLMHDIHWFTVDAVEQLLPELISRGYQIVTVRELLYYKNVELENGKVYHSSYN